MPGFYSALTRHFDSVRPRIITQHTLETYEHIKSGDIDIGFVKRAFDMPNVLVSKLLEEEMVLVRYGSPAAFSKAIHPSALNRANEIFMDWGYQYQQWHDTCWQPTAPLYHVDAAHLIFSLFDKATQWSIVPRSIFEAMKDRGPFFEQPLNAKPPNRTCYLVWHKHLSADKASFIPFIEQHFSASR
jgi:DNA-binding transcriptional LysR family regulator